MSIGGSKSSGSSSSSRTLTPTELRLLDTQRENLEVLTDIAEESYNVSKEDRNYYEKVFRDGTDTEAKQAVADLKYKITGEKVDPNTIADVNIDTLLRDTVLNATPEFQRAATGYIESANELTKTYGEDVTGLSKAFSQGIQDLNTNYQTELQQIKEQTGTINQDVLARETGAAMGGISSAYAEARKQMGGDLARRGLAGSGVEAQLLANTYSQEAMNKAQAGVQARTSALQQSEAIRQQQASLAGSQLQGGVSALGTAYQGELGGIQNVYGVTSAQDLQNYQTQNASTLQGIAVLTQVAQAGQGIYAGSANYLGIGTSAASSAASTAGSTAVGLDMQRNTSTQSKTTSWSMDMGKAAEGIGEMMALGVPPSDLRFKNNIVLLDTINGINIYSWEWNDFAIDYLDEDDLYEPIGVIAQEIRAVRGKAVSEDKDGYLFVNYSLIPEVKEYKDGRN